MSNASDVAQQSNPQSEPAVPDFKVSLHVRPGPSNGSDRYVNTVADNKDVYSYFYSGGNKNAGNVEVIFDGKNSPPARIQVSITRDSEGGVHRYTIDRIEFTDDHLKQFEWDGTGKSHVANITDKNLGLADVKYTTIVLDEDVGCSFPCDPMIKNVPRVL